MNLATLLRSFAGGEITPELFGRLDLVKYQTGLAACRNFIVLPHGPVANRTGFQYINEVKYSAKATRLIPFSFNTQQTYVLEFGDQYIRFHTNGGTLLETGKNITAITQANPGVVTSNAHGFSNGDWVYLSSIGGMTQLNGRFVKVAGVTANTFQLNDLAGANINTTSYGAYTSGGTAARVYEVTTPYLEADLFDLHYVQSADVMTIVHPSYAVRELSRLAAVSWTLSTVSFVPSTSAPTNVTATHSGGATNTLYEYVVTAVADSTQEESLASIHALSGTVTITGFTKANPGVGTTGTAHGLAVDDPVYITGVGGMTQLNGNYYLVDTVPTTTTFTLKDQDTGTPLDTTSYGTYTSGGSISLAGVKNTLSTSGAYNKLTWTAVSGAVRYNIYKKRGGLFGYIGRSTTVSFKDDNITADTSTTPPETNSPMSAIDDYPSTASYFEQRRCFADSNNGPQTLWMTRTATSRNMTYSVPSRADDSITATIAAREVNKIRHIIPLGDLLLLTSGGEWRVSGSGSDPITPTTIAIRPQAYIGASNVQPIVTGNSGLYVAARGSHIRELTYSWENNSYKSADSSLLAPHLVDTHTIVDLAYSRAPQQILWAVRDDGTLLGMTYVPEQQVSAWHRHDTDGLFKSAAVVAENNEDALYTVVQRTINSRSVRYIERLHTRIFTDQADAFFVDCGATYDSTATTTISGLWHLIGKTVNALADGAVVRNLTVSAAGTITLAQAASTVQVGLPITADVQTLPLALEMQAMGQGRVKNVNKVSMRVYQSSGIFVGPSTNRLREFRQRTTEPYGSPPMLKTDEIEIVIDPEWSRGGEVCVRQSDPLPLTILSMTLEVAIGG